MNTDKIYAEKIANDYAPKQSAKIKALKRLDAKAKNPAKIFAFSFGIISTLIFGTAMCLAMGVIGSGSSLTMGVGIAIGCLGILGVSVNYPLYQKILTKSKNKYATDIINLANEIASEN